MAWLEYFLIPASFMFVIHPLSIENPLMTQPDIIIIIDKTFLSTEFNSHCHFLKKIIMPSCISSFLDQNISCVWYTYFLHTHFLKIALVFHECLFWKVSGTCTKTCCSCNTVIEVLLLVGYSLHMCISLSSSFHLNDMIIVIMVWRKKNWGGTETTLYIPLEWNNIH